MIKKVIFEVYLKYTLLGDKMKKINLSNKAKKHILVGAGIFVLVLIVALSIPKNAYTMLFNKNDIKLDNQEVVEKKTKLIYVMSKSKGLVGINVEVDKIEDDEILQKWDLLTSKSNTYPLGYYTPVETSTKLNSYELLQNKLTLMLSDDFLNSDGKNALATIAWTFCNDEIEEVIIKVNNNVVNKIQDFTFDKIDRTININYEYETSYLFEADYLTILHNEGEFFLPVTYFFEGCNTVDFMASKLLSEDIVINKAYTFELSENEFTLNLAVDDVLTTEVINEIRQTVILNYDVDVFTINNNVMTIYEEDFIKNEVSGFIIDNQNIENLS